MRIPVVLCARCSLPASEFDADTGRTFHLDHRKSPCPNVPAREEVTHDELADARRVS